MKELRKLHEATAEFLEKAADHYRVAANLASEKDYAASAVEAFVAHGYALIAHEHAGHAARRHIDVYPHRGTTDEPPDDD